MVELRGVRISYTERAAWTGRVRWRGDDFIGEHGAVERVAFQGNHHGTDPCVDVWLFLGVRGT